ncbi:hypothetical protein DOY81_005847 [Sarcophaga bullata]|nr:hypothetical protein DOY81_005847 [Sarcophaga bullata]
MSASQAIIFTVIHFVRLQEKTFQAARTLLQITSPELFETVEKDVSINHLTWYHLICGIT